MKHQTFTIKKKTQLATKRPQKIWIVKYYMGVGLTSHHT
jgi:hypothetical protein